MMTIIKDCEAPTPPPPGAYSFHELGMWVRLFTKRATYQTDAEKRIKDLEDAQNYLSMMQSKLDQLKDNEFDVHFLQYTLQVGERDYNGPWLREQMAKAIGNNEVVSEVRTETVEDGIIKITVTKKVKK